MAVQEVELVRKMSRRGKVQIIYQNKRRRSPPSTPKTKRIKSKAKFPLEQEFQFDRDGVDYSEWENEPRINKKAKTKKGSGRVRLVNCS